MTFMELTSRKGNEKSFLFSETLLTKTALVSQNYNTSSVFYGMVIQFAVFFVCFLTILKHI